MALSQARNDVVVFSGGSAANNLVDVFNAIINTKGGALSYVIPISDNGGSSSELIRVFGGPGIGDVRSRLVRLIPDNGSDLETRAIKEFFNYRLASDPQVARSEWLDIVEARHTLWDDISSAKKELIRSFLNVLNLELVKRMRPSSVFNFANASVGNLFLTGARLFSGSFESAIYLLSSICGIPSNVAVLPAINTNFSHHICAGLANGTTITGQNSISHPSDPTAVPSSENMYPATSDSHTDLPFSDTKPVSPSREATDHADAIEDANWPGSLPVLRKPYITFDKTPPRGSDMLPARIDRIWYINPYGQEIRPRANPRVLDAVSRASCLIYSIGSLYTSLTPSLVLRGVGDAIARGRARQKILILNGTTDRETSAADSGPFSGMDFVCSVVRAAKESRGDFGTVQRAQIAEYVTHVVYVDGEGAPVVDRREFADAGIETMKVYGRRAPSGGWWYDQKALLQALEALVGRRDLRLDKGRRNTLEM